MRLRGKQWTPDILHFPQWYFDNTTGSLWEQDEIAGWVKWSALPGRTRNTNRRFIRTNTTSHQRPDTNIVATVQVSATSVQLLSKGKVLLTPIRTAPQLDWTRQFLNFPDAGWNEEYPEQTLCPCLRPDTE